MSKFARFPKLDKKTTEEIIIDFCEAISVTKSTKEAAQLLTDLLGKQELEMLARRLKIAQLLLDNYKYQDIQKHLKVSSTTIARVQTWLHRSGEGYRLVIDRTKSSRKSRESNDRPFKVTGIKKRYPMYYWPQILLEYWAKNSSAKQKKEMRRILATLDNKVLAYKELENLLKN